MKRPKDSPISLQFPGPKNVCVGLHILPGASGFENPSTKRTTMMRAVDMRPSIDVYDNTDRGRNRVGVILIES